MSRPVELDGHELSAMVLPYGVAARVVDPPAGDTGWDDYLEEFAPHAFAAQLAGLRSNASVQLLDRHAGEPVGYALELTETADALHGRFRIRPRWYDDVAQMVADGIDGISAGFHAVRTRAEQRRGVDVRVRVRAVLDHVSLEPVGAYPGASVVALRGAPILSAPTPERDDLAAYLKGRTNVLPD